MEDIARHKSTQTPSDQQQRPEDGAASQIPKDNALVPSNDERRHCYMADTYFQTPHGKMLPAYKLSVRDQVVGRDGQGVGVKWCQVYQKERRLVVDLHTKQAMLTVTGSHRVVLPGGGHIEAKQLNKEDAVATDTSSGYEQLRKVTKRTAYVQVVELEFDDDATVPVYVPTVLTKGSAPGSRIKEFKCKDEPMVDNPMGDDTGGDHDSFVRVHTHSDHDDVAQCSDYPDTDDGF